MRESKRPAGRAASSKQGTSVPGCSLDRRNRFAVAAYALWPRKTAAELAFRAKVSERAAKFWLSGGRTPSLNAVMAIVNEIRG